MLAGDLNANLERYARYYEHVHGESIDTRALIPEIVRAFFDADREFQSWSRSDVNRQIPRASAPASSSLNIKAPA